MSKKRNYDEEHADEKWLLPYSDMLTLLLALFIVLFSISNVDKAKSEKLGQQFNDMFLGGSGMLEKDGESVIPMEQPGMPVTKPASNNSSIEEDTMNEIKRKIEQEIRDNGYSDKVKVIHGKEGLEISIQDVILFNSGDAEILNEVYPLLLEISKILKDMDNTIKIDGHTDNIPISPEKFRSNWELSSMRAINVMNFWVERGGLRPERFKVQGSGQYSPKYDNSTEEGRAKNRRVEISIIRKYP